MININNITIKDFERFLKYKGLIHTGTNGGHKKFEKKGLTRPIIIQTHIEPLPIIVIKTCLRTLNSTQTELREFLEKKKK